MLNRHDLIMGLNSIPKSVSKDRITRIFKEYKTDAITENKSKIKICFPKRKD